MDFDETKSRESSLAQPSVDRMMHESAQHLGVVGEELVKLTMGLSFLCQDESQHDFLGFEKSFAGVKNRAYGNYNLDNRGRPNHSSRDVPRIGRATPVQDVVNAVMPACSSLPGDECSVEHPGKPDIRVFGLQRNSDEDELTQLMARAKSSLIIRPTSPDFDNRNNSESPWTFADNQSRRKSPAAVENRSKLESPWTFNESELTGPTQRFPASFPQRMGEMHFTDNEETQKVVVMADKNSEATSRPPCASPSSLFVTPPSSRSEAPDDVSKLDPCTVVLTDPIVEEDKQSPRNKLVKLNCFRKHFHCAPPPPPPTSGKTRSMQPVEPTAHRIRVLDDSVNQRSSCLSMRSSSNKSQDIAAATTRKTAANKKSSSNKKAERVMMKFEQPKARGIPSVIAGSNFVVDEPSIISFEIPSLADSNSVWSSLETTYVEDNEERRLSRQVGEADEQNCYDFWRDLIEDDKSDL
mmetsp:Transcript_11411/g.25404  ORF Transcript_11411/g.25404 Transcript_11411/m.25404 type:complete len:467 (+) Transcript_11411:34-1434(+)